ncbi:MAG: insulinase family protein [Bdellovibrionales bacterium]|nr:insulinase family protein [Bdellovibrionales bacterium]
MNRRVKAFDYHPVFNKTTLSNGVRIVTEHHPFTRSISAGIYVELGTRDEPSTLSGVAHFLEHLVFKGTRKRSGFEIAKSLEMVGGDLNAYTSREYTCFHAATLREHLPLALDVLVDLISRAQCTTEEFSTERDVVLAEIDMSIDDLEEYIFDLYFENSFQGHPLGNPILGTIDSLKAMTKASAYKYYKNNYCGSNLIVSVAGNVDHDEVVQMVEKNLGSLNGKAPKKQRKSPKTQPFQKFVHRSSEQVHILLGGPSCDISDPFRFESYIISTLLGGGMTSRLYQKVREKLGLVYSIYSHLISFTDSGLMLLYASTAPKNVPQVLKIMRQEIYKLATKGVSQKELNLFKTQVKGQILLGADDVENRMNSLAVNEMNFGIYRAVDEAIDCIEKVTTDSIQEYLNKYFDPKEKSQGILLMGDMERENVNSLFLSLQNQ